MKRTELNRRDFNRLTMAAFSGALAGTTIGCGGGADTAKQEPAAPPETSAPEDSGTAVAAVENPLLVEPHVCRGLNTCKGKGAGGENECAGQGNCATAKEHACGGQNECKGQGGCGETAGRNECKGKGNCHVPIPASMQDTWADARKAFEQAMADAGRKFGDAPPLAEPKKEEKKDEKSEKKPDEKPETKEDAKSDTKEPAKTE